MSFSGEIIWLCLPQRQQNAEMEIRLETVEKYEIKEQVVVCVREKGSQGTTKTSI